MAATGLIILLIAWCVACMAVPLWIVTVLPIEGMAERLAAVIAALGGLIFALWSVAKLTRSRL